LAIWALIGAVGSWYLAERQGRAPEPWALGGILLGPVMLFVLLSKGADEEGLMERGDMKRCPACAELVRSAAVRCRYCGEVLRP
jgi:hypothetical protein